MRREEMIAALVADCLVEILDGERTFWLQRVLEEGFRGFAQFGDAELRAELQRRGIAAGPTADGPAEEFCEADDGEPVFEAVPALLRHREACRDADC